MPLKTSSFNFGIYKSNLKRYWVIGFSYAFLLFLMVFGYLNRLSVTLNGNYDLGLERNASSWILSQYNSYMLLIAGFFSLVSAAAVFSYMHFQKNTAMIHSLPVTRKSLFITNYLSGLTLLLLPLLLISAALIAGDLIIGTRYMGFALAWIAVSFAINLLLYSFAVFAGMFTGHLAAQAVFYGVFNLLASFLVSMLDLVFHRFLYGYSYDSGYMTPLSPFIYIPNLYMGFAQDGGKIGVVAAYIVAAPVFAFAAFLIYRKRKMETAGDIISIKVMRPVFKYTVAFCSSILMGMIIRDLLNTGTGFVAYLATYLAGGFIGYYASEMLLRKTFRVFKRIKGYIGYAAFITLFLLCLRFDFFGYGSYVPDASRVEAVFIGPNFNNIQRIAVNPESYEPYRDGYFVADPDSPFNPPAMLDSSKISELRRQAGVIEDPETIGKVVALHRYIADNVSTLGPYSYAFTHRSEFPAPGNVSFINIDVAYRLKSGRVVERAYFLPYRIGSGDGLETSLKDLLSSREIVDNYNPLLRVQPEALDYVSVTLTNRNGSRSATFSNTTAILDAMRQDCANIDTINMFAYSRQANPLNVQVTFYFKKPVSQLLTSANNINKTGEKTWAVNLMTDNKNTIDFLVNEGIISRGDIVELEMKY